MSYKTTRLSNHYLKSNLSLAWPLAINALLMQAMLVIDTLLVSPLGDIPIAAMGIAATIVAFFLGVQLALANGSQLIISRNFGGQKLSEVKFSAIYGLAINVVISIIFVTILALYSHEIANLLTDNETLAQMITDYLSISQYILLVNAVSQSIIAYLNGQSDTKTAFRAYLFELPINILLSYWFIYGFNSNIDEQGLGVTGAALGSLCAISFRLFYLLLHLKSKSLFPTISFKNIVISTGIKAHVNEILPIATNFVVLSIGYTLYQLLFAQLNIYSYVAVTLIFPWLKMATLFIVAWAQANAISISQARGRQRETHITVIINSCIKAGMIMASVLASLLYLFSLSVEYIYPNVDKQTYEAIASIAPLFIVLPLVRSFNTIAGNSLRAMGKSVEVLKIHFITQWLVMLPLCALFVLYLELPIFWAFALLPLEETIKSIPFYLMLRKNTKR